MALVEVYRGQLEELSYQDNHRCIIKRKNSICASGAMANMDNDGSHLYLVNFEG